MEVSSVLRSPAVERVLERLAAAGAAAAPIAAALVLVAGCGGDERTAVHGSLDLPRGAPGPPDAGSRAGHGADAVATTDAPVLRLTGRVRPPAARLGVAGPRAVVRIGAGGAFAADVSGLRHGATTLHLSARAPGATAWRTAVRVVRRSVAAHIRVPAADGTPPLAWTRLEQLGARASPVVQVAPVLTHQPHPVLRLVTSRLRVTSVVQDSDGGTGRIRVSIVYVSRCPGARPRRITSLTPPSSIESVRIGPGVRVPTQRRRTVTLDLDPAGRGCAVDGEAYGEAIAAGGRESVTDPIRFAYRPR